MCWRMNADKWKTLIAKLPPRLTQAEAARRLKHPHGTVRLWLIRLNYPFVDGRSQHWTKERVTSRQKIDPNKVDWSDRNIDIAARFGVSRERVRQLRERMNIRKVGGRN